MTFTKIIDQEPACLYPYSPTLNTTRMQLDLWGNW